MVYRLSTRLFNPLYWWLVWALNNDDLRYIFIFGGSSSSKTHSVVQALSKSQVDKCESTMVLRKFGVDIDDSIYSDFKSIGGELKFDHVQIYQQRVVKLKNSRIRFRGLDDSEKLKGLKGFKYLYYNELTQFDEADFDQGRKRLRGMSGQKIIADWNPISEKHWIKTNVLDKETWIDLPLTAPDAPTKYATLEKTSYVRLNERGNMLLIRTNYLSNYWVIGHPAGKGGFYDKHTVDDFENDKINKPNYYRIYGLGDWGVIKTGGEFWKQFDEMRNTRPAKYEPGPLHVALDANVRPYVTIALWQANIDERLVTQVDELPCYSPDNNAVKAAQKLIKYLTLHDHEDVVFLYADPSSNASNAIDEENKSFYDKFLSELKSAGYTVHDRIGRSAPRVAISAAFINDMYEGLLTWKLAIGNHCSVSIDDYNTVQEDKNGGMAKPKVVDPVSGVAYEPHGHYSDAKRYFLTQLLEAEYKKYKAGKKRGFY
jgi:PBSX family phage terminase large subunit